MAPKPEIKNVPTLDLLEALRYLESIGNEGIEDRVWNHFCDSNHIIQSHSFTLYRPSKSEKKELGTIYNDLILLFNTWDIEEDQIEVNCDW